MIRQTSIDTYIQIKENGLLSSLRFEIYDCLYMHGPMTQMETCRKLGSFRQDRSIMPRFAEMEKAGVIKTTGTRLCTVTKREVLLWDCTDKLPMKFIQKRRKTYYVEAVQRADGSWYASTNGCLEKTHKAKLIILDKITPEDN